MEYWNLNKVKDVVEDTFIPENMAFQGHTQDG